LDPGLVRLGKNDPGKSFRIDNTVLSIRIRIPEEPNQCGSGSKTLINPKNNQPISMSGLRCRDERDIRMYSSPCGNTANALEYQNSPFCQGLRLLDQGAVTNVLQVGESIHLIHTGTVPVPVQPVLGIPDILVQVRIRTAD
jgi:hypothetical protein